MAYHHPDDIFFLSFLQCETFWQNSLRAQGTHSRTLRNVRRKFR